MRMASLAGGLGVEQKGWQLMGGTWWCPPGEHEALQGWGAWLCVPLVLPLWWHWVAVRQHRGHKGGGGHQRDLHVLRVP